MNARLFFKKNFLCLLLVMGSISILLSATNALASSGMLDPTFGSNGIVTARSSSASEVVLQPDGKIITLGSIKLSDEQYKRVITRYNSNGTLDNTFGVNGSVSIEVEEFSASKIALQPGGKLIVGGKSGEAFAVVRYNSNGSLDTSFGTSGMGVFLGASDNYQSFGDIAIQADGKIVVVGDTSASQSTRTDLNFARFNSDGTKDVGNILYFTNSHNNYGKAVVIQPDGKIILSGIITPDDGRGPLLSLARINQDGTLDRSTFGTEGKTAIQFFDFDNNHGAVALQSDGKIVLTGTVFNNGGMNGNLAVVRVNSNGALDSTFGGTGIVITDLGADESINDLVIQPDGKIILGGKTCDVCTNYGSSDFLLARYNSDGSLDTTFGANGKVVSDFGNNIETARSVILQPDNKVVVVGTSGENAILARYSTSESSVTQTTLTFNSADAYDGWILESGENSNQGGSLDKTAKVFFVGDDARDRQYRSILSFNTISIPDNVLITSAQIKIKKQTEVGTIPFNTHGDLLLDIRGGAFSNNINLTAEDFSASASVGSNQEKFFESSPKWYAANLGNVNLGFVNKYGVTQFRLLFGTDDNDDMGDDFLKFFSSGSAAADQPQLIVTYSTNSGGTGNRAPVISGGSAISINVPENTTTVTAVTAADPDGQPITYSISGADAGKFSINPGTGILTFLTAPDLESIPLGVVYHLTAQASDGSLTATQDIAVTVTGVNEFVPVITSNANVSLSENTTDVITISATDGDLPAQPIQYIISGGADGQLFNLDPSSGKLSFVTAPSYNAPNDAGLDHVYNVKVEISDGEFVIVQELVISIINPNTATGALLDSTFGTNGVVTTKINGLPSTVLDAVLQPDGKIITLGTAQSQKVITRYNSNGTLDTSFGTNGNTFIEVSTFLGKKLVLQSDGKLIVAGRSGGFAVVRYNSNGTLDTSFGTNGMAANNTDTENYYSVEDVTVQLDGKIVLAGDYQFRYGNHIDFEIVRFNSDGTLDKINTINFPYEQFDYGKAVVIQPDNKIIMSGYMQGYDGDYYIPIARLNPNLLGDSSFGTNGTVITPLDYYKSSSGALALQPDGRILVAGTIFNRDMDVPQNLAVARFNTDGTLDTTFGGTGIVVTDFGAEELADDFVIQANGKIILAGIITSAGESDFLLARYNSDGSLDTSFGSNGKLTTDFGNSAESVSGIVQQPNGKVIVSGTSGENAIMARYNTGLPTSATSQTFTSVGTQDGWILESGENTNQGGTIERVSNALFVGDDARDRQYRSILSFDTNAIPDNMTITSAQVRIKKQGMVGSDPFTSHNNLLLEIRGGTFNNNAALTVEDFSAIANVGSTQDKFSASDGNWYVASLSNANLSLLNKFGLTQFRLLFSRDDDDDMIADYDRFFSGNAASDQPQLIITYSTIGGGTGNQAPVINGGAALSIRTPENTTLVSGVTAIDFDGQSITYSISGVDAGLFSITPTGVLSFITPPDFEAIPAGTIYHVTAQASDGSLTAIQDISVTVTPLNEFRPVMTSSGGTDISLPETTMDVTTITTTDTDLSNPTIKYLLGGLDQQLFKLDSATGKLSFITAPSYNAPNDSDQDHIYNVNINADDGFSVWLEISITIINPNSARASTTGLTALHQFGSQADNGRVPYGLLTLSDGVLYGTTTYGGAPYNVPPTNPANKGNVFKMNMDGSGFTVLHEFTGGANDGWKPWSGLAISGGMIYGSTVYGGPRGEGGGVIYEMNTNGGNFRILHAFGEPSDGFGGSTSPILVGDTLYGVTRWGGNGTGTIYSYNTATEVYTQLHRFAANSRDGNAPLGTLTAANDGYLYGLTWLGGQNNMGTLFRIKPDGSAFETMYHFAGGTQGKYPYDNLAFDGNHTLYGTTLGEYGNNLSDLGTIFKYDFVSKTYSVLHKFMGGANDSGKPNGSVTLSSDGITLYGTTHGDDAWGGTEFGILYQINIDGTGFNQLYEFNGGPSGATPMRTPLFIDGSLYGMTAYGGAENYGLIYRYPVADTTLSQGNFAALSINANNPIITSNNSISISENNIALTTISATDADTPVQPLTYSIIGGADSALFSMNPTTGEMVFISAPNYEIPADAGLDNIYNITIQASDGVVAVTQDMVITITSMNDNNPVFTSNNAISIPENTLAAISVIATDADLPTQSLIYSIIGGADSARFNINSSTGELTFIAAPNFEVPTDIGIDNIYNVTVQASDGELVGTQDIAVTISDINDNAPAITSNTSLSVSENSTIVVTVTATDIDLSNQPLTFSIGGGPDSTLFGINPSTGELTFIAAPDYEVKNDAGMDNIYNVTIQASDGTFATTQDISITVTPVNDNIPVITSAANFSVFENITTITTITATDADLPAQPLTYSIVSGADAALFTINPSTGALDFITGRDFEIPNDAGGDNIYNITIQASDGALNVTQDIAVTIMPVNDSSPVITSQNSYLIPENITTIVTIIATDTDRPVQSLTYSVVGGADAAKFSILGSSGELTFITAPDFETPADLNLDNIYDVIVQVSDGTYTSALNIFVQVADVANLFPFESTQ
jgi:uncharacterized delta-60 repeat protein